MGNQGNDDNRLIVVDIEHIRMLKRTGHYSEAMKLIKAHQESLKKDWAEGRRINNNILAKERTAKLYKKGLCQKCAKAEKVKGRYCLDCYKYTRLYHKYFASKGLKKSPYANMTDEEKRKAILEKRRKYNKEYYKRKGRSK